MESPVDFEETFVHRFYDENGSEFSATRRRHWEMTERFLDEFNTPGSVVLDAGCGNGRAFLHPNVIGLDHSLRLLMDASLVRNLGLLRGDVCSLPFVDGTFDLILSIAVIHHLSTHERRTRALEEMRRVLRKNGRLLLYVWGEDARNKRKFVKIGNRESKDYLITWNLREDARRYYYLYSMEELVSLCKDVGFKVLRHGSEEQSLFAVLEK